MDEFRANSEPGQGGEAGVWRAIDASANRAGEALRVVEDVVRFVLDDQRLTSLAKELRHELASLLAGEPLRHRAAVRDVAGDVGAGLTADAALRRTSAADLIAANAARAAQALRSLAECAAVVAPDAAAGFEQLRYRLYTIERGALAAAWARDRLAGVNLCVLVDGRRDSAVFERLLETLVEAGVRMFQIRDKAADLQTLADRVQRALAIMRRHDPDSPPLVVVNDRVDVAAALGADGAHTGAADLPAPLARRVLGPRALLGRTAHDLAEARAAEVDGADYLGIGPCFPSPTKSFSGFAPRDFLRTVATEIGLPSFAIGGVTIDRLGELAALGITRVAVASAITEAPDPAAAARSLIDRLDTLAVRAG
jgi:thiamine-phosphate pyrophosphorylase